MSDASNDLAIAVARLARRLRQERQSELTPSQLSVLWACVVLGPVTPGHIAAHERVKPPTVTRTINSLEAMGLIDKSTDASDRRLVKLEISEQGRAVLALERERRNAWLAEVLDGLSTSEQELLAKATPLLRQLADTQ